MEDHQPVACSDICLFLFIHDSEHDSEKLHDSEHDSEKLLARLDNNFQLFMTGGNLANLNWTWTDENAAVHEEKGLFLICDGGYHLWKMLICPFKDQPDGSSETRWSGLIESLRKDVECLFGILKKRFMILKHAVRSPFVRLFRATICSFT
jgi:hypothetical protein